MHSMHIAHMLHRRLPLCTAHMDTGINSDCNRLRSLTLAANTSDTGSGTEARRDKVDGVRLAAALGQLGRSACLAHVAVLRHGRKVSCVR